MSRSFADLRSSSKVEGFCVPQFAPVRDAFRRNFSELGELGAAVCIHLDGVPVVDLWGGVADEASQRLWTSDTMAVVFSTTKGLAALCLHMLADRGQLDFEAPVARYWPEFAANGKADVTVAMVASHQAGLPVWTEPLPLHAFDDADLVTRRLAEQAPLWEPGAMHGYHAVTLGFLEGEIVRRITGRTIGSFLREEVAEPLGADVWIGLPGSEEHRVCTLQLGQPLQNSPLMLKLASDPDWFGCKMMTNSGDDITPERINSRARHAAEIPAAGGIVTARGLARFYAPLSRDGSVDGVRMVGPERLPGMRVVRSASSRDLVLQAPTAFTLGFSKTWGTRAAQEGEYAILGEHAFGAAGFGGSVGFADGEARMSFGYVMNRMGGGIALNARGQSLIDAAYRAVGFASSESGCWVRRRC